MAPTTATRVILYCRVSTDKQADRGVSLDAQETKLRQYASLYDLTIADVIVDAGQSAKSLDRPGLQRALGMLRRREADALLVVKLDRLTRSVRDLGTLIDKYFAPGKAALMSLSESIDARSAGGRLVLNVLASVSEWERAAISERTSAALQHKASQGEFTGGQPPYGFRVGADGVHLEEDPAEQAVLERVRELRSGGRSLRGIVKDLAAASVAGRTGKPMSKTQVERMLTAA